MQDGGKATGSYQGLPKVLEPESFGEKYYRDLENSSVEEKFRLLEERARDDSGAGCVTNHHLTNSDGDANDPGKKHPDVGSVDTGPRSCGTAAETVHTSLGLLIHWVLGGSIFSYVRGRAKFMDHPGQEDDGLDKKMRGSIVRLARMSHHSYQLLLKMLGAVPAPKVEYLSDIWEKNSWVWKWRTLVIPKSKKRLTRRSSTHKLSIRMM